MYKKRQMGIVITGNPGVGKHTISEKVAGKCSLEILDLNQIAIKSGIAQKTEETFDVDIKKLKNILKGKISKNTLVVGHLAPYVMNKGEVELAIILRKNPYKLDHIYKKRGYSKSKRVENQGGEILGIIAYDTITKFGEEKIIQIDTSRRSVKETAQLVSGIIAGDTAQSETVDWLEMVNSKGDMKKFFPTD